MYEICFLERFDRRGTDDQKRVCFAVWCLWEDSVMLVTLDSAKGWAGTILFNDDLWDQFRSLESSLTYTFSLEFAMMPMDGAARLDS